MSAEGKLFFDAFRLDPRDAALWRGGGRVELQPKVFALLCYFAQNPGRLISKGELLDAVWPGVHVTEAVLKVTVSELRKALGDDAGRPRILETVHRRGYRFVATVRGHNVPVALTSFIGRERELIELRRILRDHRLVTITGAGGCGKTRLAAEVAAGAAWEFADGTFWVELASTADEALLPQAVATVLGVREGAGRTLTESLSEALRHRRLLLVLDNCEHLIEACARLAAQLLGRCPELSMLATSREALAVDGERIWPVPGLSVPPRAAPDPEVLLAWEAARLFAERATAVAPDFRITSDNAAAVARVCRRLDGIPLAIEQAAARVRLLAVAQIAERLDDVLGLLTEGGRTAPARHQTLRATIDWSYRLLPGDEQRLLGRLAVFDGGFTLEAAEAVCAGDGLERGAILDLLSQLQLKSMIAAGEPRAGNARHHLLEMVRQYAADELLASPEWSQLRRRHAGYFLAMAEAAEPALKSGGRGPWLQKLAAERGNLRAALAWCREEVGRAESGLRLAAALPWYWFHQGAWSEGRKWLADLLAQSADATPEARARAGLAAGFLDFCAGAYGHATSRLEASAAEDGAGDASRCLAASFLSQTLLALGETDAASMPAADAVRRLRRRGDLEWELGMALNNYGNVARALEDLDGAAAGYREAAATFERLDDPWALSMVLRNLGIVASRQGDPRRSLALFQSSLRHLRGHQEKWFVSRGLEELAGELAVVGDHARAVRLLGAAESLRESIGAPIVPFYRDHYERTVEALRAGLAADEFAGGWQEGRAMTRQQAVALALGA